MKSGIVLYAYVTSFVGFSPQYLFFSVLKTKLFILC